MWVWMWMLFPIWIDSFKLFPTLMEWKEMGWDGMMNDAEQKKYEARVVEQRQYHPQHIPRGTFTCYGSSN